MGEINDETLLAAIAAAHAYERGSKRRTSFLNEPQSEIAKKHEENVKLYWKDSVTEFLRKCVNASYARKSGKYITNMSLNIRVASVPCIEFLSAHMDGDLEEIAAKIMECGKNALKESKRSSVSFYWILLGIALFGGAIINITDFISNSFWLSFALITLILFGLLLYFSRKHAFNNVFKNNQDHVDMMEKYCDVCGTDVFHLVNGPWLVIVCVIVLAMLVHGLLPMLPKSRTQQIQNALNVNQYNMETQALDMILLTNDQFTEKAQTDFIKVYASQSPGSANGLRLAIYAMNKTEQGFSSAEAEKCLTNN